jgi:hypothetical protein
LLNFKLKETNMKRFTKIALAAAVVAGSLATVAAPADARVFVGIGAPLAVGYGPGPVCDPYAPAYNPYYCGYGPAYGPVVGFGFGGFHGGFRGGEGFHGGGFHGGGHGGHR